jgi:hypothetical protein
MATALNLAIPVGTAKVKSNAYDNPNYTTNDEITGSLAAASSSSFTITTVSQKQLRSVTLVPTTAPNSVGDNITLTLYSLAAQAFGTATSAASPALAGGTATSTSYTKVSVFSSATAAAFVGVGASSPVYNPLYVALDGNNYSVVVASPAGTNTQTNYVFPTGPTGGLTLNPGDVLVIAKGTDTLGVYAATLEFTYTPGSNFTL